MAGRKFYTGLVQQEWGGALQNYMGAGEKKLGDCSVLARATNEWPNIIYDVNPTSEHRLPFLIQP
jgi:hypothetical protein